MKTRRRMLRLHGLPVSGGSRVGTALIFDEAPEVVPAATHIAADEVEGEIARLGDAAERATQDLTAMQEGLAGQDGAVGQIFQAHAAMLGDFLPRIEGAIRGGATAEHAVASEMHAYAARLQQSTNAVLAQRAIDVVDLERRMLAALRGLVHAAPPPPDDLGPVVVVASSLTPSEVAGLEGREVAALVLELGGPTSRSVLIAKSLGIPCVVGVEGLTPAVRPGDLVWVDGSHGIVVIGPDEATVRRARGLGERYEALEASLLEESDLPAETRDGFRAILLANVEFRPDVEAGVERGAEGVGLYRTEFLVDERGRLPDEGEQLEAYTWALERLRGGTLTIRTFDFGSDKPEAGTSKVEPNAALGERSLRWCFAHPEAFHVQLRALLRVAALGEVRVMLPMVGGVDDIRRARKAIATASRALKAEGIVHDPEVPLGVMVEIPGAAVTADLLAREADFLSIGTNDLIQYSLAADRLNPSVAAWFRPSHPSILRMVQRTIDAAAEAGIPVTMCGEMGGHSIYTVLLFGMGLRAFSLTPGYLPRARRLLRGLTAREARALARLCLRQETADDVERVLHDAVSPIGAG